MNQPISTYASTRFSSDPETRLIGLDLGGTKLHAAATGADGRVAAEKLLATDTSSASALFNQLRDTIIELQDGAKSSMVVLGVPGAVSPRTGHIDLAPNIPLAPGGDLRAELSAAVGARVTIENDVNLAALGEARHNTEASGALMCLVSFGTGIGLGIVANGSILSGAAGRAGEISYLPVGSLAEDCRLTKAGQFEDLAGSHALVDLYAAGAGPADGRTIFDRANQGDAQAVAAIETTARRAALGIAALQSILDPDHIVIGGSIGARAEFYGPLCRHANALLPVSANMLQARLGASAGLVGALTFAAEIASSVDT
ncbi:ROK family protein [Devosia sp. YIM 151766]|uniref:ROK family protein n=1 Tax=Devosia sp. YIM 151766 TaxID=3017325 RepID=UPI00255C8908|nr:ROK family protein [Devosia sp. YIM 151766]WIY53876.1 ROK family protein [Devosia sp. YIM 151766]